MSVVETKVDGVAQAVAIKENVASMMFDELMSLSGMFENKNMDKYDCRRSTIKILKEQIRKWISCYQATSVYEIERLEKTFIAIRSGLDSIRAMLEMEESW